MAIVVESTSSNTGASVTSLTITKPTGLTVGDLMVCVLSQFDATPDTITTLSGWTLAINQTSSNSLINVQYKVADSGDVAASNFTWASSGTVQYIAGGIMRISGVSAISPISSTEGDANTTASSATISFATSLSPSTDGTLLIMGFSTNENNTGAGSTSGYNVTGSSVTFTELFDYAPDAGTVDPFLSAAYGIQTTAEALTAYGATLSAIKTRHNGVLIAVSPRVDATGTNTLTTTTTTTFTQSGTCDTIGGNTLVTTTSEAFTQGGTGTSPTQWVNPDKSTTPTWNNPNK